MWTCYRPDSRDTTEWLWCCISLSSPNILRPEQRLGGEGGVRATTRPLYVTSYEKLSVLHLISTHRRDSNHLKVLFQTQDVPHEVSKIIAISWLQLNKVEN